MIFAKISGWTVGNKNLTSFGLLINYKGKRCIYKEGIWLACLNQAISLPAVSDTRDWGHMLLDLMLCEEHQSPSGSPGTLSTWPKTNYEGETVQSRPERHYAKHLEWIPQNSNMRRQKNKLMARELFWIKSEWIKMIRK